MITLKQISLSMVIIACYSTKTFTASENPHKYPFSLTGGYATAQDSTNKATGYPRDMQKEKDLLRSIFSGFSSPYSQSWLKSELPAPTSRYFDQDSSASYHPWQKPCDEQARNAYKQHLEKQALLKLQSDVDQIKEEITGLKAEVRNGFSDVKSSMAMILYSITQIEASLEKNHK